MYDMKIVIRRLKGGDLQKGIPTKKEDFKMAEQAKWKKVENEKDGLMLTIGIMLLSLQRESENGDKDKARDLNKVIISFTDALLKSYPEELTWIIDVKVLANRLMLKA